MTPDEIVGSNIRTARLAHDWSQAELGRRLSVAVGKSYEGSAISRFERGRRSVRVDELVGLSVALELSVEMILGPIVTQPLATRRVEDVLELVAHLLAWVETAP